MNDNAPLPPWLQRQIGPLLAQRSHALLLAGAPGLGQYRLALALAQTWLCETPVRAQEGAPAASAAPAEGLRACGHCPGCHAVAVRTHPDLFVLMPELLALEHGWPLDPRTQDKIDKKEVKPSAWIRVDAARAAVAFGQITPSRAAHKVVLIHPANRLNLESANALLKTLEEPAAALRFVLTSEATHALLPTLRSRCVTHPMHWPGAAEALDWLRTQVRPDTAAADLQAAWLASGGRPEAALDWLAAGLDAALWASLPRQLAHGAWPERCANWSAARLMQVLQQLCHDLMRASAGAAPRYFAAAHLPRPPAGAALNAWQRDLLAASRTLEHPFQAALLQQAWALRARLALSA